MTDKTLKTVKEALEAILCDPDGNVCIRGSDGDRQVVQQALDALNSYMEARTSDDMVEINNDNLAKFLDSVAMENLCCGCSNNSYTVDKPFFAKAAIKAMEGGE